MSRTERPGICRPPPLPVLLNTATPIRPSPYYENALLSLPAPGDGLFASEDFVRARHGCCSYDGTSRSDTRPGKIFVNEIFSHLLMRVQLPCSWRGIGLLARERDPRNRIDCTAINARVCLGFPRESIRVFLQRFVFNVECAAGASVDCIRLLQALLAFLTLVQFCTYFSQANYLLIEWRQTTYIMSGAKVPAAKYLETRVGPLLALQRG